METVPVLVITGPVGVGKTSVVPSAISAVRSAGRGRHRREVEEQVERVAHYLDLTSPSGAFDMLPVCCL